MSSNPRDSARLSLDKEVREIEEGLRRSDCRDNFVIRSKWAVNLRDLRRAILDCQPQIVHFCGHGTKNGIVVEDDSGNSTVISPSALSGLFKLFSEQIECVVLNACYSKNQAKSINKHIPYVVGMRRQIQDNVAIEFSVGFYDALGAGKKYEEAFEFGRNAIQLYELPQNLIPVFYFREDLLKKTLSPASQSRQKPYNNLVPKNYPRFIGREIEIEKIIRFLKPEYGINIVTIDGVGGVGKTSLALEIAHRCLAASKGKNSDDELPRFDAIIFTTAKQNALTASGILPRYQSQRCVQDIIKEITDTLATPKLSHLNHNAQVDQIRIILTDIPTLLIVDNLETIEDKQSVMSFLFELPSAVKVIVTTRERQSISPIRLTELPEADGLQMIKQRADESGINLSKDEQERLYEITGGVPAAIVYALGQISNGYSMQAVVERTKSASGDVAKFCFESSVDTIRGTFTHEILMSIALFPKEPLRPALAAVSGYASNQNLIEEGLSQLQRLSLVTYKNDRFSLLPLTREYTLSDLSRSLAFERHARERWVEWYLQFVQDYGGGSDAEFFQERHVRFDYIDAEWENILEVLNWCAERDLYKQFKLIWDNVIVYASDYSHWEILLNWTDWLIEEAERRGDYSTKLRQLSRKATVIRRMGKLQDAAALCEAALELREFEKDPTILVRLLVMTADTETLLKDYKKASLWLDLADEKLTQIDQDKVRIFQSLIVSYFRAHLLYECKDPRAKALLQEVIEKAQPLEYQRAIVWSQKYLADIEIEEGNYEEAEHLLNIGMPVMQRNKDKFGIAFYARSFAYLERARNNDEQMTSWAKLALKTFDELNAESLQEEMKALLNTAAVRPF